MKRKSIRNLSALLLTALLSVSSPAAALAYEEEDGDFYTYVDTSGASTYASSDVWDSIENNTKPTPVYPVAVLSGTHDQKIAALKSQFPTGRYWNHKKTNCIGVGFYEVDPDNDPEKTTTGRCTGHSGGASDYMCNQFAVSYRSNGYPIFQVHVRCGGFAQMMAYKYTGQYISGSTLQTDLSKLKAGDILVLTGHNAFVYAVSGNTIYTAEGNYGGGADHESCRIQWTTRSKTDANVSGENHIEGYYTAGSAWVNVSSVSVNSSSLTMYAGDSRKITASVSPSNATNKDIYWMSSDASVCSVAQDGTITANKAGTATVSAMTRDGSRIESKCTVTVKNVLMSKLDTQYASVSVPKSSMTKILFDYSPSNTTNPEVEWTIADSSIAKISGKDSGSVTVTGLTAGTTTLTGKAKDGSNVSCSMKITVTDGMVDLEGIAFDQPELSVQSGSSVRAGVTTTPADATTLEYTWSSDNDSVAKVDSFGRVTGVNAGSTVIRVKAKTMDGNTVEASCKVTVSYAKVTMFRLYNPNSGEHFYTNSVNERDTLIKAGWKNEGTGWIAPNYSNVPVYRLYNANAGDHHYTTSLNEKNTLVSLGWTYEEIGWYSDPDQSVPVYRQYNPNAKSGSHNYTCDANEDLSLEKVGWRREGIGWYALARK